MKPIEIHIEGYKIVISEDEKNDKDGEEGEKIVYVPCPSQERPHVGDWWINPSVTW